MRYAVVEADSLITSNTDDGRVNPQFPAELQPRDRGRGTSQTQIASIAANLNPRLLDQSPKASDGAPIIAPSGVVESGNGRTLALRRAYEQAGEPAQAYRDYLTEQGFDIEGMDRPVLVRVRDAGLAPPEVAAFTREANERDTLGFSSTEQAIADARALPDMMLDLYRGGDIDAAGNRDFVRRFMGSVIGQNDQAGMIGPDGAMSQQAVSRIRGALLAKAYDNERLVGQVTEATDTNIKAIGGALTDVAADWARMRAAAADGRIDPAMDATRFLNEAVDIVDRARREGRGVGDYVDQRDIFSGKTVPPETEAFLRLMFANRNFTRPTGRERLAGALRFYVEQAMLAAPEGGMFSDDRATPLSVAELAKAKQDRGNATGQADFLTSANADAGVGEGAAVSGAVRRPSREDLPKSDGVQDGNAQRIARGATDEETARNVHAYLRSKGVAGLSEGVNPNIWLEQQQEQIDNPNRYHRVQQLDNPLDLKIGDRVRIKDAPDVEAYVTTFSEQGSTPSVHVSRADAFGGFYSYDKIEPYDGADSVLEAYVTRASAAQKQLVSFGERLDRQALLNPGPKTRARIKEKVETEGYASPDDLKDGARIGFVVNTVEDADRIAAAVLGNPAWSIEMDKGWVQLDGGYLDRKIIVRFENGVMGEVQIVPRPVHEARQGGLAKAYDRWRTMPAGPAAEALRNEMRAGYAASLTGTPFETLASASRSAPPNRSLNLASDSASPSLFASPGAENQAPSRQTQAEPPAPRSDTVTGRPSISKNSSATADTSEANIGPKPKKGKPAPSANKIFTEDAAERARQILKDKFNQINSGLDPELAQAGITLAGYHIEKGARTFAAYASAMIEDLGEKVRPYLRGWYEAIRYHPGMEDVAAEMSGPEDIGAALAALDRLDVTKAADRPILEAEETDGGVQGSLFGGDVRASPANDEGPAAPRRARSVRSEEERGSPPDVRPDDGRRGEAAERSGEGSDDQAGSRESGDVDADRVSEREPATGRGRRSDTATDAPERVTGQNWQIEPGALDEARGPAQKARDNLKAVEVVKELDASGLPATREQQAILAKYVGWGGLKNAFAETDGTFPKGFETIGPRLKELLSEAEYDTARRSIQYAHYTSEKVVRPMWEAARRLGFKGGKVFEPGMGTGNFLGMMPADLAAKSQYAGLEFDYITARIAQLLYPQSGVQHADYTRNPMPEGAFDLVIGNPPFSQTVIRSDPKYSKNGFVLHDFFFAKSLDAVRPGGLLMFITSAGTLNKVGTDARQWMAERADFVGAVRLPGDAFAENAGTKVTTDIIILRKKDPTADAAPWANNEWISTSERELPTKDGTPKKGAVNSYFDTRPEMVLGEEGFFDTLIASGERYAVRAAPGQDMTKALAEALERLPADVMTVPAVQSQTEGAVFGSREKKDGSFYIGDDGRLMQQRGNQGVPVEARGKGVTGGISSKGQEKIKGLIPVRDALRDVFAADLADNTEAGDKARKALNASYDAFVKKFGPINKAEISYRRPTVIQQEAARNVAREETRLAGGFFDEGSFDPSEMIRRKARSNEIAAARRQAKEAADALGREWDEGTFDPADMPDLVIVKRPNIDAFMDDQEGYRLRAIEHYNDDTGEAKKSNVFFENVITKERPPQINSPNDALLYTLNKLGRPDLDEIAFRAGLSRSQVLQELSDSIYRVPDAGETYQTREMYLSGNVRVKLEQARAAAARDPAFKRNVEALEAVQPTPLGPADISANLGMPWIPPDIIEEFATDALELQRATVRYRGRLAQWSVDGDRASAASRSTWGTSDRDAITLLSDALNRQDPKVYKKVRDVQTGKERDVLDPEATQGAQDKVRDIKARFSEWVWSDTARADKLAALYNRDFNNLVAPQYDGSYLTTPGIASWWSWRPHQSRVVARIIQSGNTYMAHGVGAGKTSAMIGAGMEMRRLGLVKKPMYAVPNHMLGQFTKEFYEQYPTAKIMVADERQFHTDRRKQFVANMAAEDLDAVIITHSAFGYIPISEEFNDQLIQQQIDEYRDILDEVKAEVKAGDGRGDRFTQRRIEQQIEAMQQKLSGRLGKKDQVFTFEETGVDFLFVDEAHLFRKLDFATKMGNVRGIDPNGSQMSYDLFAKTRYLETKSPGRSHVLASGTAITNTMAELFSLSRYLQPAALAERGLSQFDAWAGAFGDTVTALEQDPAGGYKPQTRFAKFVNVPELSAMVRQVMDVVTSKQLEEYVVRPKLKGGKRNMVVAEPTENLKAYQDTLTRRMEAIQRRSGPPSKGDDILLSVIGDGRKAAIDMRLVDPSLPADERSKVELLIKNVVRIAKETKRKGFHKPEGSTYAKEPYRYGPATQMIFSDLGINGDFPIHKYIANSLVAAGIPRSQVAIISDHKNHVARQRLFNDVNEGKVRVLIGSVPKMGTGVNAQRQLYAIHNLDPQWYPANDEQRNGRGLRQGNENPEIEITDYSTKGTYDSTMWGLMETKARFIEGFFAGDPTMRTMDDLGEASQYEQAKAITTADPRILEMTQYKQDLERALIRKAAFEREQYAIRERIRDAEYSIERLEARVPQIEADIAQRTDITGDAFTAKVGKETFTDRTEFGAAVIARMEELAGQKVSGRDKPVGEIGGFKLTADVVSFDGWGADLYINRNGDVQERIKTETEQGISSSAAAVLRGFETDLDKARDSISRYRGIIEEFRPQLDRTFTGQAEIDDLTKKAGAIEDELTKEAADRAAPTAPTTPQPEPEVKESRDRRARAAEAETVDFSVLERELKEELGRVGIADRVALNATTSLFGNKDVMGRYNPTQRLITVALDRTPNALQTFSHEVVHAFRDIGLFRSVEWSTLARRARGDKKLMARIRESYPELTEEQREEEAVAEMYAMWRTGTEERGFVRTAFERIRAFLDALSAVLGRYPGIRAEGVMRDIAGGQIAARPIEGRANVRVTRAAKFAKGSMFAGGVTAPDPDTVGDILNGTADLVNGQKSLGAKAAEAWDKWRIGAQDRMLPLLRTQTAAEKVARRILTDAENPYVGEELMSGKVGAQLQRLTDKMVGPLFEAMREERVTVEELESYLYARHAPERNEQIAKINPAFADGGGSGMTDIQAKAILSRIRKEGRLKSFEIVADRLDRILKFAVDTRVEAGLMSAAQAAKWRETYKHYVPLRGLAELEGSDAEAARPQVGPSGVTVRGPESLRAFGRRSRAEDILAYSIMQAEEAIIRGQKNMVARQFYELAKATPDDNFWKLNKVSMGQRENPTTGLVESYPITALTAEDKDFTVSLKIDGKERRVTMNQRNPAAVKLAEAMRRLNEQQTSAMLIYLSKVNRWLSTANTALNPDFIITNAFRDLQAGVVNLSQFEIDGLRRGVIKDYMPALFAATKGAFGKEEGGWGAWWKEFTDEGGRVFYNQMQDIETLRKDIERRIEAMQQRSVRGNLSPKMFGRTLWNDIRAVYGFVEKLNLGVENAIRLAAYKNARESGMSKQQAASLAKNLTVNFNRRGSWGVVMNSLYLFYNASIQGSASILMAMKYKPVRKLVYGMVVAGAANAMLNIMLSGTDDDDELIYDKMSEFDKSRNIIIMLGGSKSIKWSLPYGYNAFFDLGRQLVELGRGRRNPLDILGNFTATVVDAFNPIGGSGNLTEAHGFLSFLAPTIFDPAVDLGFNKDFAGRPIMPNQNPYGPEVPDAQRYWESVNPMWKGVTDMLTRLSGGDDVQPGKIDMSPETLEHLFGVVVGAAGATVDRLSGTVWKAVDGDPETDISVNDIPVVRKIIGDKPGWYDKSAFYARTAAVEQAIAYAKGYAEQRNEQGFRAFVADNRDVLAVQPALKRAQRAMRQANKEESKLELARDLGRIDEATYRDRMQKLMDIEDRIRADFNRAYLSFVERPVEP